MPPSTTGDTLQAPRRAWQVPVLVVLGVATMVLLVLAVAQLVGWFALVLVPVALFGLSLAINVVVRLIKGSGRQKT